MNRLAEAEKRLINCLVNCCLKYLCMIDIVHCSECYNTILLYQIGYSTDISPAGNKAHYCRLGDAHIAFTTIKFDLVK